MERMLVWGGLVSLLIWLYLFLLHGRFWRISSIIAPANPAGSSARVAVVVPARDEAEVIGRSVASLVRHVGLGSIDIFVVDDGSTDGTPDAAARAARDCGQPERVRVIPGRPLAPGWSGKLWAVQQGIEQAAALNPDFLLLTDADIEHSPESVATLVDIAQRGGFALASFMVRLH